MVNEIKLRDNMKRQIGIVLILLAIGVSARAQNEKDAFRYAQYSPTGTARYSALAGSMGAFGADFSCLSAGNPAGIGLFKRIEFTFTPSLFLNKNATSYNDEKQSRTSSTFNVSNLGIVLALPIDMETGWKNIQFAMGLNNLARYDGYAIVSGQNEGHLQNTTNFFNYVATLSDGIEFTELKGFAREAFKYWLIDTLPRSNNQYQTLVDDEFCQQQITKTSGYLDEYVFSFGGNYDNKLFFGATVGVPFFRYNERIAYSESKNSFYDSLIITDELSARATGVNVKIGVIYQPIKYMRVGAAFHSPTWYPKVKETTRIAFDVWNIKNYGDIYDDHGENLFIYRLRTPYRAMANIAFIYKSRGFINIDYEYVDYAVSELQEESYNFSNENECINKYYTGTHTIKAGGELNLSPLVLRVGYAYSTNPYNWKEVEKDGSRHVISGGIGYKSKSFYADLAYMHKIFHDKDVFYDHISLNPYTNFITNQIFALTLGWKVGISK